jgi:hypothetical protein
VKRPAIFTGTYARPNRLKGQEPANYQNNCAKQDQHGQHDFVAVFSRRLFMSVRQGRFDGFRILKSA